MTIESWIGVIVGISTIITSAGLGVRWLVRHYFDDIKHELKPNSGQSLKDQVTRLEKEVIDLKKQNDQGEKFHQKIDDKIENLTTLFVEYVSRQK